MPILDLDVHALAEQSLNALWAHVQFPDEPALAFAAMVRMELNRWGVRGLPGQELVQLPACWITALMADPGAAALEVEGAKRSRAGVTAGMIMMNRYFASTATKPASQNDAIEILRSATKDGFMKFLPAAPYESKGDVIKSVTSMASAAHLWAGLCAGAAYAANNPASSWLDRTRVTFQMTSGFQRWALNPSGLKRPLIDPATAWLLTPPFLLDYELPPRPTSVDPLLVSLQWRQRKGTRKGPRKR